MNNSYCPGCGSKIEVADSQFCTNCGYKFEQQSQTASQNTNNQNMNYQNMGNQNTNSYDVNNNFTTYNGVKAYTNGMGIAGLVVSIISLVFCCGSISWLGLIFSIIGMNNAKKNNGSGNGLAIAGLIVSIVGLLFMLVWLIPFMIGFTEGLTSI